MDKESENFEDYLSEIERILENLDSTISKLNEHFQKALKSKEDFLQLAEKTDKIEEAGTKFDQLKSKLTTVKARRENSEEQIEELKKKLRRRRTY